MERGRPLSRSYIFVFWLEVVLLVIGFGGQTASAPRQLARRRRRVMAVERDQVARIEGPSDAFLQRFGERHDQGKRRVGVSPKQTRNGGFGYTGIVSQSCFALKGIARGMRHQRQNAIVQLETVDFRRRVARHGELVRSGRRKNGQDRWRHERSVYVCLMPLD